VRPDRWLPATASKIIRAPQLRDAAVYLETPPADQAFNRVTAEIARNLAARLKSRGRLRSHQRQGIILASKRATISSYVAPDHAHRPGTSIGRGSGRRTRVELAEQGHAVGEAQLGFATARRLTRSRSVPARDTRAACDRIVHRGSFNTAWDTDVSGLGFSGTHTHDPGPAQPLQSTDNRASYEPQANTRGQGRTVE